VVKSYQTVVVHSRDDVYGFSKFPSWKLIVCPKILYEEGGLGLFAVYSAHAQGPFPRSVRVLLDSVIRIPACVPLGIIHHVFETFCMIAYNIVC